MLMNMRKYNPTMEENFSEWAQEAPCKKMTDLFFSVEKPEITEAIKICSSCPFEKQCDTYATENKIEHGVWGGKNRSNAVARRSSRALAKELVSQVVEIQETESPTEDIV
jgi:hypothetical protein